MIDLIRRTPPWGHLLVLLAFLAVLAQALVCFHWTGGR
jgi:hypothetical protein